MEEIDEGRAKLTSIIGGAEFEVDYSIVFTTNIRRTRTGLPPVRVFGADVKYVRAVDGGNIPEGEYLLTREQEMNRVKNLGFGQWSVLSWPPG